jgi:DNA-binding protein HU-beta
MRDLQAHSAALSNSKFINCLNREIIMRKAGLVSKIKEKLKSTHPHLQTADIVMIIDAFTNVVKEQFCETSNYNTGENDTKKMGGDIYIRGFGSFVAKVRARKMGRNIKKNKAIEIPEHTIVAFKPAKEFADGIKKNNVKSTAAPVVVETPKVVKTPKTPKAPKAK